ncbi:MAG: hypothetical protein QM767_12215, partial [Anaeromyxobacter sp.]
SSREVKGTSPDAPKRVVPPAVALSPAPTVPGEVSEAAPAPAVAAPNVAPLAAPPGVATTLVAPAAPLPRQYPGYSLPPPILAPNPPEPPVVAAAAAASPAAPTAAPAVSAKQRKAFKGSSSAPVAAAVEAPAAPSPSAAPPVQPAKPDKPTPAAAPPPAAAAQPQLAAAAPAVKAAPPAPAPAPAAAPPASLLPEQAPIARAEPNDAVQRALKKDAPTTTAKRAGGWKGPVAIGLGAVALGATGYAAYQWHQASETGDQAESMLQNGAVKQGLDPKVYYGLRAEADSAQTGAYVSASVALVAGVAAGVLGWQALHDAPPDAAVAVHF